MGGEAETAHLADLRWRNYSPTTISQRRNAVRRLERFTGKDALDVDLPEILLFRDRLTRAGQALTIATQHAEIAHLAGFYRWALLEGWREDDPMLRVPRPRLPRWMPHPIPEHDLARAIDTASDRIRPWLYLAAFAGLRACEIAPLRAEDLWWHTDPPLLVVQHGKGGDPGTVPISPVLEPILRLLPRKGWLFTRHDGAPGPNQAHLISHLSNAHLHRIGIALTLHSLRHRFGTQVYRASGRDMRQTQELMRHRSPVSTAVYTLVDQSEAAGIVAALPPVRSA